jgi:hypothetical protein
MRRPYFPFELGSRDLRPLQGYLFKLPAAFVELFPELDDVPRSRATVAARLPARPARTPAQSGGRPDFAARNDDRGWA